MQAKALAPSSLDAACLVFVLGATLSEMMNQRRIQRTTSSHNSGLTIFPRFAAWTALITACVMLCPGNAHAKGVETNLPSDTPNSFDPRTNTFDYLKREEMVPMRDGVKLKTFILVPK